MNGITFNNKHSFNDFNLILNSRKISTPSKKKIKEERRHRKFFASCQVEQEKDQDNGQEDVAARNGDINEKKVGQQQGKGQATE